MQHGEFMKDVRDRAGVDADRADKAVRATLNTLAQRLAGGEPTIWRRSFPRSSRRPSS